MQKPEVILFDLGGVIVDVASRADIHAWMPTPLDLSQWTERWPAEDVFEADERKRRRELAHQRTWHGLTATESYAQR